MTHASTVFLLIVLGSILLCSAFFSMAETAIISVNKYRLRLLAPKKRGARIASKLIDELEKTLGALLIGNNLLNTVAVTLVGVLIRAWFDDNNIILGVAIVGVTFAMVIFAEITPKIIGARYANQLIVYIGYLIWPWMQLIYPAVWFVNALISLLLKIMGLGGKNGHFDSQPIVNIDELRVLVSESSRFIAKNHRNMILNLVDLEKICIKDVMIPRTSIEYINIDAPLSEVLNQIKTSYHSHCPLCRGDCQNVVGVLPIRLMIGLWDNSEISIPQIIHLSTKPYFIAENMPVLTQLQSFRETSIHFGLVVDKYGDVIGLATVEDILEEVVGEFSIDPWAKKQPDSWKKHGFAIIDASENLRDINRMLKINLPLSGPKTLNGLILDHLSDFPEGDVSFFLNDIVIESAYNHERRIRSVKLFKKSYFQDTK